MINITTTKYCKHLFLIVSVLLALTRVSAQGLDRTQLDSIAAALPTMKEDTVKGMAYQTLGRGYSMYDLSKAMQYGKELEQMSKRIKWDNGLGIAYNIFGYVNLKNNVPDSAYFYYKKANEIYKNTGNKKGYAATHANLGNVALHKANFPKALENYMEGLRVFEAINERPNVKTLNMNIGLVFGNMKMYTQSKQYLKTALKLYQEDDDEMGQCMALVNIGSIFVSENKFTDSAKIFLNQAVDIAKKHGIDDLAIDAYLNLAMIYIKEQKYDSVRAIINNPLIQSEALQPNNILSIAQLKANLVLGQNKDLTKSDLQNVLGILLPADSLARAIEKNESVAAIAKSLSTIYEKLGDNKNALFHFKRYHQMADSIDNSDNRQALKNLEHQREIELKDTQLKFKTTEMGNQKRMQWIGAAALLAAIILGTVFWYQNKQRKIANQKLSVINNELDASNKVKARFFSILSHDLRAPIASLSNYIYLLKEDNEELDVTLKAAQQNKLELATNNLLSTMEDILLWSKSQMERFEPIKSNVSATKMFDTIKKLIPEDINIKVSFQDKEAMQFFTDEQYLNTIMRNLTANAIKALKGKEDGKIEWSAYAKNGNKYLSITDNGPGLSQEQKDKLFDENAVISTKTGLGLHLVRDLVKMLGHQLKIDASTNKGSIFTICF